ncbi:hypothetical protein Tco_0363291 [Tanacetum coccineum]
MRPISYINVVTWEPTPKKKRLLADLRNFIFIDKCIAFLVVEYYVHNIWANYGIEKVMRNSNGLFLFKFNTKKDTSLQKENLSKVPVWVKLNNVFIAAFNADGSNSFSHALIKLDATFEFKYELVVAFPRLNGVGYARETIQVTYEWKPSRCCSCRIFGHLIDQCPRNIVHASSTFENDGFQEVGNKRSNASKTVHNCNNNSGGRPLKSKFRYELKGVGNTSMETVRVQVHLMRVMSIILSQEIVRVLILLKMVQMVMLQELPLGNTSNPTNGSYRSFVKTKSSTPVFNLLSTLKEDNDYSMDDLFNDRRKKVELLLGRLIFGQVRIRLDKLLEEFRLVVIGTNEGKSNLAEKWANSDVVSSTYGNSSEAFSSPNTTLLAIRINDLERQMLDKKRVLVDDDGKLLEKEINMSSFCMPSTSMGNDWKSRMMKLRSLMMILLDICLLRIKHVEEKMMQVYLRKKILIATMDTRIRSMFEISGNNFNDWFRQFKMVLRVERKLFVIEQPISLASPTDSEYLRSGMRYMIHNEELALMLGKYDSEL